MKNESGDMGHRRGPDAGRSALGPFEEGPKAGEMALEATKGRLARARFSRGGREEGWTLAGKCLAGGQWDSVASRRHPCPCGGLIREHRMDAMWLKATMSFVAERPALKQAWRGPFYDKRRNLRLRRPFLS